MSLTLFNVGMPRTGTLSLAMALRTLGYNCLHHAPDRIDLLQPDRRGFREYDDVDAVTDAPAMFFFRAISDAYPECRKWILTKRPAEAWMQSVLWHWSQIWRTGDVELWRYTRRLTMLMFGTEDPEPFYFQRQYKIHNEAVVYEAAKRGIELLEIDLTAGEGWDKLCPFLDRPIPDAPFPWENRRCG